MDHLPNILKAHQPFHPVVPFNPLHDKLLLLDFTEKNIELVEILNDTIRFTEYINFKLQTSNSKYGIGGFSEHRTVYRRSKVFDAKIGEDPRRLHLGIDIWGKPYTRVMAPLDGIVHSFAFNNALGDYGATIILTHQLEGFTFHTLYGHLSLNSIKNLQDGDLIKSGDVFAEFGIPFENGQWPPHLHFQIIIDMQGMKGDYPGVCAASEKEKYLANCPDPDLILNMMQYS
jgi:murein DD-endopeptidase MepM/ murein hydrolase activator NlpD